MFHRAILLSASLFAAALVGCASPSAPAQAVSILEPADGATVTSPFKLRFGVKGLAVAPAGDVVAASGHHHLLINVGALPAGESVPFTDQHGPPMFTGPAPPVSADK